MLLVLFITLCLFCFDFFFQNLVNLTTSVNQKIRLTALFCLVYNLSPLVFLQILRVREMRKDKDKFGNYS